jgi:proline iminopeptidase
MSADSDRPQPVTHEGFIPAGSAALYFRAVGHGRSIIVLHGGPDFDHTYLLPDLDRLSDGYRLICYDQRGRGRSTGDVPGLSLSTEVDDLNRVRQHFQLDTVALLGHSWGGVLALAYALRHPGRVSHLLLLNSAPAAYADILLTRQERQRRLAPHAARLEALAASPQFVAGDPASVGEYYRLIFSTTIKQPKHLARLNMRFPNFTAEGVQRARAIEEQLYLETYAAPSFDLLPQLQQLLCPALVLHGDYDFVPIPVVARLAHALPNSRLVVLPNVGHFAYLEAPAALRAELNQFFHDRP